MAKKRKRSGQQSGKASQKAFAEQLARLASEERILLQDLKAKKIRKLVADAAKTTLGLIHPNPPSFQAYDYRVECGCR